MHGLPIENRPPMKDSVELCIMRCFGLLDDNLKYGLFAKYIVGYPVRNYPLFQLLEAFIVSDKCRPFFRGKVNSSGDYTILYSDNKYRYLIATSKFIIKYLNEIIFYDNGYGISCANKCINMMLDGSAPKSFFYGYNLTTVKGAHPTKAI